MKSSFKGILVLTLITITMMVCAAKAADVEFTPVAVDLRPMVEERLKDAVIGGNSEAALKWAQTLKELETQRITREAGDAVIPLLKGYAGVTKEFGPQLEAVGPVLKALASSYISSQLKNNLIPEGAQTEAAKAASAALEAKTKGQAVEAGITMVNIITEDVAATDKANQERFRSHPAE